MSRAVLTVYRMRDDPEVVICTARSAGIEAVTDGLRIRAGS